MVALAPPGLLMMVTGCSDAARWCEFVLGCLSGGGASASTGLTAGAGTGGMGWGLASAAAVSAGLASGDFDGAPGASPFACGTAGRLAGVPPTGSGEGGGLGASALCLGASVSGV